MDMNKPSTPAVDKSHWAYQQGRTAGLAGKTTERGIMAFGFNCAGDRQTAINTKHWLQGFDAGVIEAKELAEAALKAPKSDPWNDYGDRPPRSRAERYAEHYA